MLEDRHALSFCATDRRGPAAAAVSACATLQPVQTAEKMIGSSQSSVRDTFGAPTETYQMADGKTRWIYSSSRSATRSMRPTSTLPAGWPASARC